MSNLEERLDDIEDEKFIAQYFSSDCEQENSKNDKLSKILKSTENIAKISNKLKKRYSKKFKKYKLRDSHEDDPDVVEVSKYLNSSLKLSSPSKRDCQIDFLECRSNYLSKMAKKSSKLKNTTQTNKASCIKITNEKCEDIKEIQSNQESKNDNVIEEINFKEHEIAGNCNKESTAGDKGESKAMNAFMLMMGARSKSIGSNSPGKQKAEETSEDLATKKSLKLKRSLALEKMALAKGAKKNEELEALRDEKIKSQMTERAKKLKSMITTNKTSLKNKSVSGVSLKENTDNNSKMHKRYRKSESNVASSSKRLKTDKNEMTEIFVICSDEEENIECVTKCITANPSESIQKKGDSIPNLDSKQTLSVSDVDFLNKLSPSIKKKESVLCYFDKLNKKIECEDLDPQENCENIIKVKFTPKRKLKLLKTKKSRELKQSEEINDSDMQQNNEEEHHEVFTANMNSKRHRDAAGKSIGETEKTKNNVSNIEHIADNLPEKPNISIYKIKNGIENCERRSKRIVKKPVKYDADDSESSDNDVQVHSILKSKNPKIKDVTLSLDCKKVNKTLPKKNISKETSCKNKSVESTKLAPIFAPKSQVSKADLEAKQIFLNSGIPEQLKKIMEKQKSFEMESENFSTVCHIQQKNSMNDNSDVWNLTHIEHNINQIDEDFCVNIDCKKLNLKFEKLPFMPKESKSIDSKEKLQLMKESYPKFPVYRIFKQLKSKCFPSNTASSSNIDADFLNDDTLNNLLKTNCDDPKTSIWCHKFRPTDTNDIIGNFDGVSTLKQWLKNWKECNFDGNNPRLRSKSDSTDSSDYYYHSDSDSRNGQNIFNNVLVVVGPSGCGKTTSIYAVANELSIRVIEMNTSCKRSGKVMLLNLQEATQSHKVNRGAKSTQNSQEIKVQKKKKKKITKTYSKKQNESMKLLVHTDSNESDNETNNMCSKNKEMSLILIEDADLIFDQDDGFISALNQIIQTSKRPVILVTSSLNCPHLQKFTTKENIITFHPLSPKMLGMWLDVMCLVEKGDLKINTGQNILECFGGDIRKSINLLQFWIQSNSTEEKSDFGQHLSNTENYKKTIEDESSSMSWDDQDTGNKQEVLSPSKLDNALFRSFITTHDHDIGIVESILQFPVDHLNIWWNLPDIFKVRKIYENDKNNENERIMKQYVKLIDNISVSDVISAKTRPVLDVSVVSNPWKCKLLDSVSEEMDMSSFNRAVSLGDSLSYALLTSSISSARRAYNLNDQSLSVDYTVPGYSQMRHKEKLFARHNSLCDCISLSSQLDRRSLSMDYFSACRELCRIEKGRSDCNTKRNNRFCHYLRSLKVNCSGETLELLGESLRSVE